MFTHFVSYLLKFLLIYFFYLLTIQGLCFVTDSLVASWNRYKYNTMIKTKASKNELKLQLKL